MSNPLRRSNRYGDYLSPSSENSSINPSKFRHCLLFTNEKKNSTYNSEHDNSPPNMISKSDTRSTSKSDTRSTSKLNTRSTYKSNTRSTSKSNTRSTSKSTLENSNNAVCSPVDSVNFNRFILNNENRNSTIKPRIRNKSSNASSNKSGYLTASKENSMNNCSKKSYLRTSTLGKRSQTSESIDLNNNEEFFSDDDDYDDDVRITTSYMRDCAIYGLPSDNRIESFNELIDWWIYSFIYDFNWFFVKNLKNIIILIILFILFEIFFIIIDN